MDSSSVNGAAERFGNLYLSIKDAYQKALASAGLTDGAFEALSAIYLNGDGCLQKDVLDTTDMAHHATIASLRKLRRQGIVSLEHEPGEGVRVYLTRTGKRFVDDFIAPMIEAEQAAFDALAPDEARELVRLTGLYAHHLRERMGSLFRTLDDPQCRLTR